MNSQEHRRGSSRSAALRRGATMVMVLAMSLGWWGCPSKPAPPAEVAGGDGATTGPAPTPTPTAAPTPPPTAEPPSVVKGQWVVRVSSDSPAINPDMYDTPEKRAKVFFDHEARVERGRVRVEHKGLKRDWLVKDDQVAAELDQLVMATDWQQLQARTAQEEPSEGGTQFHFVVTRGDSTVELKTGDVGQYPELTKILDALKSIAGAP